MRKSVPLSFAIVSAGEVADGVMTGTPAGPETDSATGNASPLPAGPTMASTPSISIRRWASVTACWARSRCRPDQLDGLPVNPARLVDLGNGELG